MADVIETQEDGEQWKICHFYFLFLAVGGEQWHKLATACEY